MGRRPFLCRRSRLPYVRIYLHTHSDTGGGFLYLISEVIMSWPEALVEIVAIIGFVFFMISMISS